MGSALGGLLGGDDGGAGIGGTTAFQSLPKFAQRGFEKAITEAHLLFDDPSIFGAAPITQQQQQALGVLAQGAQPLTAERFGQQLDVFQNPFTQQVLDPALADLQRLGQSAFGDIGAQASQAGAFGGTRQAVREAELGRTLAEEAGRLSANVRSQGFESAANRALNQLARQQTGAATLFDAGEALRQLQQQTQQAPIAAQQNIASLLSGVPAGGGQIIQGSGGQGLGSTLGQVGQLASGAASLASLFSDERLKENIEPVGVENGYPIYKFNYINIPDKTYIGVMAQDVENIKPEAVIESEGYKMVNYDMIGVELREAA